MVIKNAENYRDGIMQLLSAAKLPVDDLPPLLNNFLAAVDDTGQVIGVAGFEIYGTNALLRSVAVKPEFRNQGIADKLLQEVESMALLNKLKVICLLTETAPEYFSRKGYTAILRGDIPEEVKQSSEFSHVCPVSAIVMKKEIN